MLGVPETDPVADIKKRVGDAERRAGEMERVTLSWTAADLSPQDLKDLGIRR